MLERQCIEEIQERIDWGSKSCLDIGYVESDLAAAYKSLSGRQTLSHGKGENDASR